MATPISQGEFIREVNYGFSLPGDKELASLETCYDELKIYFSEALLWTEADLVGKTVCSLVDSFSCAHWWVAYDIYLLK